MELEQAARLEAEGRFSEAEAIYRQILALDPEMAAAWHALGLLVFNSGNLEEASQCLARATLQAPLNAIYHRNLGEMLRRIGHLDRAIACGEAACKLSPADLDAHYNLGLAYGDAKHFRKAISCYRKALKINPKHGLSWNNLGAALEQQGDKVEALKAYEKAVAINPSHAEAQNNQGAIYSEQGQLDQARDSFNNAIVARADFVEAHYNLCSLKTYQPDDPHLTMLESVYRQRGRLNDHARIRYGFALGKALDDIQQYDRAFSAYEEANRIQHAILPYEESRDEHMVKAIIRIFNRDFFEARQDWKGNPKSPIFIMGMPRSGTTLLEQILCSHASVYGAGELVDLNAVIGEIMGVAPDRPFTEGVSALKKADIRRIGDGYAKRVWKLSPKSEFITDKMPANFFYLGLIHLALPNARIIHAMRDPMDSCFSCYSRLFNDTMEFAYDLGTLGRYYRRYMALMKHWHDVLPEGRILDLRYEDMVEDTEGQARRVLDFVGLPWDPSCLEFHKNERLVKTASVAQVRKPIYKTSLARWKHFARHLQPLLDLVREFRDPNDEPDLSHLPDLPAPISAVPPSAIDVGLAQVIEQAQFLQGQNRHQEVLAVLGPYMNGQSEGDQAAILWHLQGISLYRSDRFEEARQSYQKALDIRPDFASALNSFGFLLQDVGEMPAAIAAFDKAIALVPEMAMARLNLGMAQLKVGDFENGWENYEARWTGSAESAMGSFVRPDCGLPMWDGNDVEGADQKGLLIITEQGFGDTFQFTRYLPELIGRFGRLGFACSQPTARLMEWSFGNQVTLFTKLPNDTSGWDYQCAMMSLPRAFKTQMDSIPATVPYLKTTKPAREYWRTRLEKAAPGRFRIGIAWAGRPAHQCDARRSLRFEQILPLLKTEWITWVSLQKWAPEQVRSEPPESVDWLDWTDELNDFADTAALLENLDLVLSIDSSMVHLAGGLNRPVWMMNRFDCEWRWMLSRADSPWYPNIRIFNQPTFGDWATVLADVQRALQKLPLPKVPAKIRAKRALPSLTPVTQPLSVPLDQPKPATMSIDQALQLANQHQAGNRLAEAEQILRQILQMQPKNTHALHLLGVVYYQAGNRDQALILIRQAIDIEPTVALFHSNLAEMCRQQGQLEEAIAQGRKAVELDPESASANSNLGIALYDANDFDAAEACHHRALAIMPNLLHSMNNLGSIERARGNKEGALEWYRKVMDIYPDYPETQTNLGAVLVENDEPEAAIPILQSVLKQHPNSPEALCNLGLARFKLDQFDAAETLLRRSLQVRTEYPTSMLGLARVLQQTERMNEAEALLKRVIELEPDRMDAYCHLGSVYTEMSSPQEAEAMYQAVLGHDPKNTDALTGLANLRLEGGNITEAAKLLEHALEIHPENLGALFHLSQTRTIKKGDSVLSCLEACLVKSGDLSSEKRVWLHYALGKAYDDLKEYDKAFPHFLEGAKLQREKIQYSADADASRIQQVIDAFTRERIEKLSGGGDSSETPVFILGMPRSGTTLTEQIIASHPQVFGAGELRDLLDIAQQPIGGVSMAYPNNASRLTHDVLSQWGAQYLDCLRKNDGKALRITDKMPGNYMGLGLIHLMLPNAKIIHVKRNPVDTCLSCFTRLFNRHQDATYDLTELGKHYIGYSKLMDHWRAVLPVDRFIEVEYEDIVADMETQARRLIDWCGLDWDDACLAFHKNKRNVRTASVTQVRKPIYKGSVERWRHYENYLEPLLKQLKPLFKAED
jgi:tetratricopeptide (TPR) repeat protein